MSNDAQKAEWSVGDEAMWTDDRSVIERVLHVRIEEACDTDSRYQWVVRQVNPPKGEGIGQWAVRTSELSPVVPPKEIA